MSEGGDYGHTAMSAQIGGRAVYIDSWSSGQFVIRIGSQTIRFEESGRFGPLFIDKEGNPLPDQEMPESSPFWKTYQSWRNNGRPLGRTLPGGFVMVA
jgi:hypothetical protein